MWFETGVTVRKRSIWVKIVDFSARAAWKFGRWHWKTIGHISYAASSCIIPSPYLCEFKLELESGNGICETGLLGFDLCDLDLWPLTLTFCMDITFVNGNHSWKFPDNTMRGTLSSGCDGQTDVLLQMPLCKFSRTFGLEVHDAPHLWTKWKFWTAWIHF